MLQIGQEPMLASVHRALHHVCVSALKRSWRPLTFPGRYGVETTFGNIMPIISPHYRNNYLLHQSRLSCWLYDYILYHTIWFWKEYLFPPRNVWGTDKHVRVNRRFSIGPGWLRGWPKGIWARQIHWRYERIVMFADWQPLLAKSVHRACCIMPLAWAHVGKLSAYRGTVPAGHLRQIQQRNHFLFRIGFGVRPPGMAIVSSPALAHDGWCDFFRERVTSFPNV